MLNEKEEIIKLVDALTDKTSDSVLNILREEGAQKTSDLISLVLSAHVSSMFHCMKSVAKDKPKMLAKVNTFIREFTAKLSTMQPITNIRYADRDDGGATLS